MDLEARERLTAAWEEVRSSLWFVPGVLTTGAIVAAALVLRIDASIFETDAAGLLRAFSGSPDSARQVMGVIAGSMISILGVSFSVVVIALVLASNQFSPRVLRNFTADRANQTALGVLVATFVYSLLILRSIRASGDAQGPNVPALGVALGIVAAIVGIGYFIYFIHHIARGIQVSNIVSEAADATERSIEELFGRSAGPTGPARSGARVRQAPDGHRVDSRVSGHVVRMDEERLVTLARAHDLTLESVVGPGDFVVPGEALVVADGRPDDPAAFADAVRAAYVVGFQRTIPEDPTFGFRELADIGIKAISPAVNDPTTACTCINQLARLLRKLAESDWPDHEIVDDEGTVRLRMPEADFDDYLGQAFAEIRLYGGKDLAVVLHLLQALGRIAGGTEDEDRRDALLVQAYNVMEAADRELLHSADRAQVNGEMERLAELLGHDSPDLLEIDNGRSATPVAEVT